MRELTHEEKQLIWNIILGAIVVLLVTGIVFLTRDTGNGLPPVGHPDYHMNPF